METRTAGEVQRLSSGLVGAFFLLVFLGGGFGAVSVSAEEIDYEVQPVRQIRGRTIDGRIVVPWENADQVKVGQPDYPEGLRLITGMYVRPVKRSERWGGRVATEISFRVRTQEAGIFPLGPFTVTDGSRSVSTGVQEIVVLEYDERNRPFPLQGEWEGPEGAVYVGQTFPLILRMRNLSEIRFPDRIRTEPPVGALMEKAGHLGEIETVEINEREAYHVPAGSWMITPTRAGNLRIPSARVDQSGLTRATGRLNVEVLPLPAGVQESGAVGRFDFTARLSSNETGPGEPVVLTLRVEGRGNLSYLQFPEPAAEGLVLVGSEEGQQMGPCMEGYKGYREKAFQYTSSQPGTSRIRVPEWSSLDPGTGLIRREDPADYRVSVAAGRGEEAPAADLPFLGTGAVLESREPGPGERWYHYLVFLPGLLCLLIPLGFRLGHRFLLGGLLAASLAGMVPGTVPVRAAAEDSPAGQPDSARVEGEAQEGVPSWLAEAQALTRREDWPAAAEQWREVVSRWPRASGAWFNLGGCYAQLERPADTVWALRQGLRMDPDYEPARRILEVWEKRLELEQQYETTPGLTGREVFLLIALTGNLFLAGAALLLYRRNGLSVIFLSTMGVLLAGALAAAGVRGGFLDQSVAVVRSEEAVMKRVPGDLGRDWLSLPPGTTVRILGEAEDDVLAVTGYGLKGWLDRSDVAFFR